jgi:hypothetical protein
MMIARSPYSVDAMLVTRDQAFGHVNAAVQIDDWTMPSPDHDR